jgi:3-dehydroquinate synthase
MSDGSSFQLASGSGPQVGETAEVGTETRGRPVSGEPSSHRREEKSPSLRCVEVRTPSASYDVWVGYGIARQAIGAVLGRADGAERAALVCDAGVPRRWRDLVAEAVSAAGLDCETFPFEGGETAKTLDTAADLLERLAGGGLHRRDLVIAVGGGVTTDLAGFVAAVYMRGVRYMNVSTTLLGMVDAAIGGKTAVNLGGLKNMVGSFHQPIGVVCDVEMLGTLPEREFRTGLAEVLKYGFLFDESILSRLKLLHYPALYSPASITAVEDDVRPISATLIDLVASCVEKKAYVVSQDEKESGLREILNFGHTLGHAIEAVSAHSVAHGEAVAVGMVFDALLSRLLGLSDLVDAVVSAVESAGLPSRAPEGLTKRAVREAMYLDKKFHSGSRFVLLRDIGKPEVMQVDDAVVDKALEAVGISEG